MPDEKSSIDVSISGFRKGIWKSKLLEQADAEGMSQELGERHFATFIDRSSTLIVTFETQQGIRAMSETQQPFGFELVKAQDWSHLCIISDGDTWFRDAKVYGFFDRLIDDGFFEDFDHVVFYGAGPCGYAASAFSVASPGATVVAIQPQATLDPRMTEWDDRFTDMRRVSFTDRYGYAPICWMPLIMPMLCTIPSKRWMPCMRRCSNAPMSRAYGCVIWAESCSPDCWT